MWQRLTRETLIFDWSKFHPGAALLCLPAIAASLAIGLGTGHARQGVMAAAGAFSVGFGSFQALRHSRRTPMLLAAIVMCISSWIGTAAGNSAAGTIFVCTLWGFLYGTIWTASPGTAWIALQGVVWLAISTAYPQSGLGALTRGSLVLAGGLLQMIFIVSFWQISGFVSPPFGGPSEADEVATLEAAMQVGWRQRIQALRAALILGIAAAALSLARDSERLLDSDDGCHCHEGNAATNFSTRAGSYRGHAGGGGVGDLAGGDSAPDPWVLAALVVLFTGLSYLMIYVNYVTFAVCLTAYVVFLLALAGLPESAVIAHRSMSTILGGAIALAVHAVFSPAEKNACGADTPVRRL